MLAVDLQSPIVWDAPLNRGLLRWWLCLPNQNRGNTWRELSRKSDAAINGATVAGSLWRPGGWGCYQYDGTNDGAQTSAIDLSAIDQLTFSCWCYWSFANDGDFLVESSPTVSSNIGAIVVQLNVSDGTILVRVNTSGGGNNEVKLSRPGNLVWNHYVFCFDRSAGVQQVVAVYVNGISQSLTQTSTNVVSTGGFGNWQWNFMCRNNASNFGLGSLDDVRLYNRVLRASEAVELYRASKAGYPDELRWLASMRNSEQAAAATGSPFYYQRRRRSA